MDASGRPHQAPGRADAPGGGNRRPRPQAAGGCAGADLGGPGGAGAAVRHGAAGSHPDHRAVPAAAKSCPGLRRAYPKLKLYLREERDGAPGGAAHDGHLDVLLMALPYDCGNVETAELFNDRFSLALPKDHPLARQRKIEASAVRRETLLLLEDGHCLRDHALSACRIGARACGGLRGHQPAYPGADGGQRPGRHSAAQLAIDGGILAGSNLVTRPMAVDEPWREIALVWRKGTGTAGRRSNCWRRKSASWRRRTKRAPALPKSPSDCGRTSSVRCHRRRRPSSDRSSCVRSSRHRASAGSSGRRHAARTYAHGLAQMSTFTVSQSSRRRAERSRPSRAAIVGNGVGQIFSRCSASENFCAWK